MSTRGRKLSGGSTSLAISIGIALALCVSPLAAQKTILSLTGRTITFPAPTAADYIAGFVNSTTGVTFTINSQNGVTRTTTISIRTTSPDLGNGKSIADLEWRRSDLATWSSISLTDAQVEQRQVVNRGLNDPWSNTIFFRMSLNWTTDAPATYSASYTVTLSQTVP
ncbi:MAG: hypothetical protein ABI408_01800 [Gemmatimonadaceae bacterium]